MTTPADIAETLRRGARMWRTSGDRDVAELGRRIDEWLDDGAQRPLGKALSIERRGGPSIAFRLSLDDRNKALQRIRSEHKEWRDLDVGPAAKAMIRSFDDYASRRWSREGHHDQHLTEQAFCSAWIHFDSI
jgi:hypothetical protein